MYDCCNIYSNHILLYINTLNKYFKITIPLTFIHILNFDMWATTGNFETSKQNNY